MRVRVEGGEPPACARERVAELPDDWMPPTRLVTTLMALALAGATGCEGQRSPGVCPAGPPLGRPDTESACVVHLSPLSKEDQAAIAARFVAANGGDWEVGDAIDELTGFVTGAARRGDVRGQADVESGAEARQRAIRFLERNCGALGLGGVDLAALKITATLDSPLIRPLLGWRVEVDGAIPRSGTGRVLGLTREIRLLVGVGPDGQVRSVANRSMSPPDVVLRATPALTAEEARRSPALRGAELRKTNGDGDLIIHRIRDGQELFDPRLTVYERRQAPALVGLAYELDVGTWFVYVDACTGAVLGASSHVDS